MPGSPADPAAAEPAASITRRSGSNLALSFVSLPPEKKEAMTTFYAFCRVADDVVDDPDRTVEQKKERLDFWRSEIRACGDGTPTTPLARSLASVVRAYSIPTVHLHEILDGVQMDVERDSYDTFAQLETYCYRVASAVGLVSIEIFGYRNPRAREYATALGMAFQLTNILRDVRYDLEHYGRIYIPREEMEAFGVTRGDFLRETASPARHRLLCLQYQRAEHYFHRASRLLPREDRPNFIAAEVMTEVYHALLQKLRCFHFPCRSRPVRLTKWEKILALRRARKGATLNHPPRRPPARITVIGAGFAGMSAAYHLARLGHAVDLLESRPYAGGRAHSFRDAHTGLVLDNGQHILMGCYHACLEMIDGLGVAGRIDPQDSLHVPFVDRHGRRSALDATRWPKPFDQLGALLGYDALSRIERLRILPMAARLRLAGPPDPAATARDWLTRLGQSDNARRALWEPFCVAALNEPTPTASALLLYNVLRASLFGRPEDSRILVCRTGLSELFLPELEQLLRATGGALHLGQAVQSLEGGDDHLQAVVTSTGRRFEPAAAVCAAPWTAVRRWLPEHWPLTSQLRKFTSSPILAVHLLTDRPLLDTPFLGFLDSPLHWLFDRTDRLPPDDSRRLYCAVSSASHDWAALKSDEIKERVWNELCNHLPSARHARIEHAVVYKSADATWSACPEIDALRPGPQTPWHNFLLAGDWTRTGLPATLEGAALSGKTTAYLLDT